MRFTILTQYYPPEVGAPQVRLAAFARELRRYGHNVHVVTALPNYPSGVIQPTYKGKILVCEHIDNIPVTRTWIYPATGRNIFRRSLNYFSFVLSSLFGLASVPRADILFVESPPLFLCLSAWLMAMLRRQKLCINISDLWPDSVVAMGMMRENILVFLARYLERWLYRQSWRICVVTEGMFKTLTQEKGVDPTKILFLPNGVDINLFSPQAPDLDYVYQNSLEGKYIFAYTGTHGYAQGLDIIIEAAKKIQNFSDIVFLFVGDGPEKNRLKSLVKKYKLRNVVFMDAQPPSAMPRIFALTHACIVPLRNLPLFQGAHPSKIFPALSCAKPVIYCGTGEAAELIRTAQCGFVIPPEDEHALATAILCIYNNPDEAVNMGKRGRALVQREYSWSIIVERWLDSLIVV